MNQIALKAERKAEAEAEIARTRAALVDKAHELERRISQSVDPIERTRERPWQMVAVAFGVGLVVGWLS